VGEPIASAGFISATVAPADRFEAWREAMAPSHDIRPAQAGLGAPQVASIGWLLENLFFSDLAFSPICYRRWRGKSEGNILLRLYEEGQADGLLEEASFQTRPGEIHLFDLAPECRGVTTERHRVKSIFIPYAAVRYDPGRHPAHISVGADTAVGRVLWSSIQSLFTELPHARRAEAAAPAAGFANLVNGLLLSAAPSTLVLRRRLAMRRYLDDHLEEDPELGVASLCTAFSASRATIYRDFAADGGVERFIVRRRLDRAFRELANGPPDRGRVRRVAERWGSACPYHFSRAFRRAV
jgi:AraC-like DNA-binding protein